MFQRIQYEHLNSRQKENFNFQKVAAEQADYGFNGISIRTLPYETNCLVLVLWTANPSLKWDAHAIQYGGFCSRFSLWV